LSVKPVCKTLLSSAHREPGAGNLWIESTYTFDGKNIAALVSEDRTSLIAAEGCNAQGEPGRCWTNEILAARSDDMGQSFSLYPPASRTVASLGTEYPSTMHGRFGAFTASNIVAKDSFYYTIISVQGDKQPPGACLFRTENPLKPYGWRAWDGNEFSIDMTTANNSHVCSPLKGLPSEVRSISYVSKKRRWIAVFASRIRLVGDTTPLPGFYYAESEDLKTWSAPRRILAAPTKPREGPEDYFTIYPSLIDPGSGSKNFETIDSNRAILTFTKQHLVQGRGTMNRDLMYVFVDVE
jgi:hypothetical protein